MKHYRPDYAATDFLPACLFTCLTVLAVCKFPDLFESFFDFIIPCGRSLTLEAHSVLIKPMAQFSIPPLQERRY